MTRRAHLPGHEEVRRAVNEIVLEATQHGRPVSVLGVAQRFALSNTTFRRNFPDIVAAIAQHRGAPAPTADTAAAQPDHQATLADKNTQLRRHNTSLHEHLELAIAHIHRLSLDNHQLRRQLEDATAVVRIDRSRP